jgi:hypothetical protein
MSIVRSVKVLMLFASLTFIIWSCKEPGGGPHGNTPPDTRLANIPPNDTVALYIRNGAIPEIPLSWVGDDQDGFVIAYKYRWVSQHGPVVTASAPWTTIINLVQVGALSVPNMILVQGNPSNIYKIYNFLSTLDKDVDTTIIKAINDSLASRRPFAVPYKTGIVPSDSLLGGDNDHNIAPTKGTFIFFSPADSNMHTFEVKSVDNNDVEDPSPAVVHFWTLKSPIPSVRFRSPSGAVGGVPSAGSFAIRYKTELWPGLRFTFDSFDASTFDLQFSWKVDSVTAGVDSLRWSPWNASNDAYLTALDFATISADTHKFYVRGRNRYGVIGSARDTTFVVTIPEFDRPGFPGRTLILNNNRTAAPVSIFNPDSVMLKAYYSEVMDSLGRTGNFDIYTTQSRTPVGTLPTRKYLGNYSTVFFVSEQRLSGIVAAQYAFNTTKQQLVKDYLVVGGKLLFDGPQDLDLFIGSYPQWADSVFHMDPNFMFPLLRKNRALDFIGAKGLLGYATVRLDSAKFPVDSTIVVSGVRVPAMRGIALGYSRGFAETISLFDSGKDSVGFENQPLGVRFLAPPAIPPARPTYSVVYFGFPLYFAVKSDLIRTLQKGYADIND